MHTDYRNKVVFVAGGTSSINLAIAGMSLGRAGTMTPATSFRWQPFQP